LIVKDRVIGALTIDHSEPGYYIHRHAELGMAFANQAAVEFENARLYNETLKRADEMKTMFSVQQAITSRLEIDAVLKLIADEAKRLTFSERTAVFLLEGNDLVLSVFSGKDSRSFLGYRLPVDKSAMGKALMSGRTVTVNNTKDTLNLYADLEEKADVKSFLSIPLMAGNKPIGTITVVDKLSGKFTGEDEHILGMLGSIAVIGLENARLYQEEKRRHLEDEQRRHVAEGLRDILAILNSNRPLGDILDFIINQAVRLMGTNAGALYRLQKDDGILNIEASVGMPEGFISDMSIRAGFDFIQHAIIHREPIAVPDFKGHVPEVFVGDSSGERHRYWLLKNFSAFLAVPIVCDDELYGGIVLFYPDTHDFTRGEIDLAISFTDQAALAIDNARLRAQAEEIAISTERSRLARELHDAVTQTLFSASLIADVLPKIWERSQEEGRKRLDELRQLTRGALAEMRTLLLELRPATLVESGLKELLQQLAIAVTGRARIPISLEVRGEAVLEPDVKIVFYRIAQEALNNISKHSGASKADVILTSRCSGPDSCQEIELCIRDNGYGFDAGNVTAEHLGLHIMRERAEAVGAEFIVDSAEGRGTDISVRWRKK